MCGAKVDLKAGRCPACGGWLPGARSYITPVAAIAFFSFVSIVSFAIGIYSILTPAFLGPILGFIPLIVGWGCLWVMTFHYRPMLKAEREEGATEIMGPYDR